MRKYGNLFEIAKKIFLKFRKHKIHKFSRETFYIFLFSSKKRIKFQEEENEIFFANIILNCQITTDKEI